MGQLRVELTADAIVSKDGAVPLGAFVPGEEVLVVGTLDADGIMAHELSNVFRPVKGVVTSLDENLIATAEGEAELTDRTRFQDGVSVVPFEDAGIEVGDKVSVLTRFDPNDGDLVAVRVYERE